MHIYLHFFRQITDCRLGQLFNFSQFLKLELPPKVDVSEKGHQISQIFDVRVSKYEVVIKRVHVRQYFSVAFRLIDLLKPL